MSLSTLLAFVRTSTLHGLWKTQLTPDLRAGLTSHVKSHPEWDRVLFPEQYLPASAAPAPVSRP